MAVHCTECLQASISSLQGSAAVAELKQCSWVCSALSFSVNVVAASGEASSGEAHKAILEESGATASVYLLLASEHRSLSMVLGR